LIGVVVQLVGILAIAVNIIIYQQKKKNRLLLFKLISDFLWFLHYLLLGAYSGAAVAAIGIFRETVFINQDKKWAKGNYWLLIFIACSIFSSIFSWKGIFSLLPAIASVLSVISFWRSNPKLTRFLALAISACMFTYDVICGSYMGMANEIFTTASAIFGILRYDIMRKIATNTKTQ
jgi:hypothetical protein